MDEDFSAAGVMSRIKTAGGGGPSAEPASGRPMDLLDTDIVSEARRRTPQASIG
jgi:hypothetical protein